MPNRTMRIALIAVSAVALAGSRGSVLAEEITRDYHETFDVNPGMKLNLEHGDGDVTITPWGKDVLDIVVVYRAKAANLGWVKKTDFEVDFSQEGDTIRVIGREPKQVSVGISAYRELEYSYTVQAPGYLELELAGEDGDVVIAGWRGAIVMRLEDGDVQLSDIQAPRTEIVLEDGDLEIDGIRGEWMVESEDGDIDIVDCHGERGQVRAEDGDIELDHCEGSFEISAEDGDIRLSELAASELDIRSADGSVNLGLLRSDTLDLRVRVEDGDVVVDLEEGVSADFELQTQDGRIQLSAVEVHDLNKEKHRVTGRIGDDQGSIYVRTSDGSVTLRQ